MVRNLQVLAGLLAIVGFVIACSDSEKAATPATDGRMAADAAPAKDQSPMAMTATQGHASKWVATAAATDIGKRKAQELPGLHNVFQLSPNIISGSEPHGEEAFVELQKLGVKTIVSSDAKAPEAEIAKKYGIGYVHIPFGYHGIGEDDQMRLAKTFTEKPGPFYVHCFHGMHRGPSAAAVGRIVLDGATNQQAVAEMYHWCGTSKNYSGLYETIGAMKKPSEESLKRFEYDFPSAVRLGDFIDVMIAVARAEDHLKAAEKRAFAVDPHHPDVDAENEAAKLEQVFAQGSRLDEVKNRPEDFRKWMEKSERLSHELQVALKSFKSGEAAAVQRASELYKQISATCVDCHKSYRNYSEIKPH